MAISAAIGYFARMPVAPKWEKFLLILGATLCSLVILATLVRGVERTDLMIFLNAATNLEHHRTVYSLADANEHTKPPLATLLFIPLSWLSRATIVWVWDALNILSYLGLAWFFVWNSARGVRLSTRAMVMLALLVTLNPWNKEIRLGQYNVLTMILILSAGYFPRAFFSGFCVLIAVLMKPTNVVFVPWVWKHSAARWGLVVGTIGAGVLLGGLYCGLFGVHQFWSDHLTWLEFLPQSGAKHLHRDDNFGLLRVIDEAGGARLIPLVWAAGWAAVLWTLYRERGWLLGFGVCGIVSLLLTPMAWFQNYVLLLPFVVWLLNGVFSYEGRTVERVSYGLALGALYLGLEINPAVCNAGLLVDLCRHALPLWSLLAAIAFSLVPIAWKFPPIPVESVPAE